MAFDVGDRVIARIPALLLIPSPTRTEAVGTVAEKVEKPGGTSYTVKLDEPGFDSHLTDFESITNLSEDDLRPLDSEDEGVSKG